MNNRKLLFVAVIGVVFLFAGYNLYSYFQTQAEIAAEEERAVAEKAAAREAKKARLKAEKEAEEAAEKQRYLEKQKAKEEKRRAEEARRAAKAAEKAEQARISEEENLKKWRARAREFKAFEGIRWDRVQEMNSISPRFVSDHPGEFLNETSSAIALGSNSRHDVKVFFEGSDALMMFSAISRDLTLLQALIDIGMDVNASNEAGITPLMFAATYNGPEVVQFLIGQGADLSALSYIEDMNLLHFATRYNPNPETAQVLLDAGLPLEAKTTRGATAALLAASENRNMEVIELLANRGADLGVYNAEGKSAFRIAEARLGKAEDRFAEFDNQFVSLTAAYAEQVYKAIQGQ